MEDVSKHTKQIDIQYPSQSLTQLSKMASGGGVICLAWAEPVKKGNRRILGASNSTEVTVLWKEVISRDRYREKRGESGFRAINSRKRPTF